MAELRTGITGIKRMLDDLSATLGGMIESLRDDVRAIADGHLMLNDRVGRIETGQEALREQVGTMHMDVNVLSVKMDRVHRHLKLNGRPKRKTR